MAWIGRLLQRLPLSRAYSLVSLIGILLVALAMAWFYNLVAIDSLKRVQTEANVDLTRAFANTIRTDYGTFLKQASMIPAEQLRHRPELDALEAEVMRQMKGLRVVKIKIYNTLGLTVYSTESAQIGEPNGDNLAVQRALTGEVVSYVVYRDRFNAFDQIIEQRDLVSSYIPVYDAAGAVIAVFELYTDVTLLLGEIRRAQFLIIGLVVALMLGLYLALLVFVRHADGIIRQRVAHEREMQKQRIRYFAQHDQLTGLPNRQYLALLIEQMVARLKPIQGRCALFYIDVDRFKLVNDSLGQGAGDQLLLALSDRIADVARERHLLGRIGGDEFLLVLEGCGSERASAMAGRLLARLAEPFQVGEQETALSVAIGITLYPDDSSSAEQLIENAGAAMLQAKRAVGGRFAFFTPELNRRAMARFELERDLRLAIARNAFEVFYQPRVAADSGAPVGAEALLRWRREDGELVSPAEFIPALEQMGAIVEVGAWVLHQACRACRSWHQRGHTGLRVSVNLSMRQFHDRHLVDEVQRALQESSCQPNTSSWS
jgi:diguanylate cyclase (GGDEF)-like protein